MPNDLTINEALVWAKTLKERHSELVGLRNENSKRTKHYFGQNADKERVEEPLYDVKALDKIVAGLAKEMRVLEQAIKNTNATTKVIGYQQDDAVLGELT